MKTSRKVAEKRDYYLLQEIILYFITVFGVLMSPMLPYLVQIIIYADIPDIPFDVWHPLRIGAVMFVALLMTFAIERDKDTDVMSETQRKKAKQKNFKTRMVKHLAYGALWSTVLEGILEGAAPVG